MKSKNFKSLLAGIMLLLSLFAVSPFDAGAQGPIKFEYGSKTWLQVENGTTWQYTECQQLEGDSCTTAGAVTRINVTAIIDQIKKLAPW